MATSTTETTAGGPPLADERPIVRSHHGIEVADEFEWLRDRDNPDVIAYLEAENAWTDAQTAHLAELREQLFTDIKTRTKETDLSVPRLVVHTTSEGEQAYWYYARTEEGKQYEIVCRVPVPVGEHPAEVPAAEQLTVGGQEQIVIDENAEAEGQEFFDLGAFEISPGGRYMAYLVDVTGGEVHQLRVRDLATGQDIGEPIEGAHYGLAWLGDDTLFYTMPDAAWRRYQVRRRVLSSGADTEVLTEPDERFSVFPMASRDGSAVLIAFNSKRTAEWRIVTNADAEPVVITPRREGIDYKVEHAGDRLLILHNHDAKDFALAQAPLTATSADDWTEVIPHRPGVRLNRVSAYNGHVVLSLRRDGLAGMDVIVRDANGDLGQARSVKPDEPVYAIWHAPGANVTDQAVRYRFTSLVTPETVAEFDTATGQTRTLKTTEVLDHPRFGPYRAEDYVQQREWALASDGTKVPVSIVYRKDALDAGPAPCLLYGYGSYETCIDPYFRTERLPLVDRGVVFAIAHIRGGGEMGREWYEQGRTTTKRNTFSDFVAVAEHLIAQGYTTADRLAAEGRSAGGLLMGAVANLAPDKFRAIHAGVPFVDPLTTCLNPDFPLIVDEWEEWGNALHDAEAYNYLASYAPYDNLREAVYPALLATTSLNDIRVYYTEPAKWIARLRRVAKNPPDRPILLKTEMVAGHAGPSGRYGEWRHIAFVHAWLLDQIGVTE